MMTIGEVLKAARESQQMSQEEVASKIRKLTGESFSRAALAQIEAGTTKKPKPDNLQAACDVLKIDFRNALKGILRSVDSSVNDSGVSTYLQLSNQAPAKLAANPEWLDDKHVPVKFTIPLLSWVRAGEFCEAPGQFSRDDAEEWLPAPLFDTSPHTFALIVRGDSMDDGQDGYKEGDIVYIDPTIITPSIGNDVLANTDTGLTLKRYKEDEQGPYLLALNGKQIIRPSTPWQVCGVVVFSGKKRR